jgi:carboxymethylenebutenolidase
MPDIKVAASGGGEFDCYLSVPGSGTGPALIIMSSIFGVDEDVRGIVDDLADKGIVAAAPELFWRTDPGPMPRTEDGIARAKKRSADRDPIIEQNVQDLADVIATVKRLPECNGRIGVAGLCFGGPFAFLGPTRLGCDAGFSFHGTDVEFYLDEVAQLGNTPVRLHWGDEDHACPPETMARIRAATDKLSNVEITTYPGVRHGYTAPSNAKSWNQTAAEDSWTMALAVLNGLPGIVSAA